MALDFKLMFGLHGVAMVMFVVGEALTVQAEAVIQSMVIVAAFVVAIRYRRRRGWRWARAGVGQLPGAIFSVVAVVLMIAAVSPSFSPNSSRFFPWYMALGQIGLFNLLASLKLARLSETDFAADCDAQARSPDSAPQTPSTPGWRVWVRGGYTVVFFTIWCAALGFFYVHGVAMRDGAARPSPSFSHALSEHGRTVFVTDSTWALHQGLMGVMMAGIPAIIVTGLVLQRVFGVPLYANFQRRNDRKI